ncbi:MAG: cobalamin-binding protein [Chloroflexota bacterium]|nr:cobalamin-binding protein [Chloroflexota bacterium]
MRIVSMLPGATEMVYLLGLGEQLYGVSHECDYPLAARTKRKVTRSPFDSHSLSSAEIDQIVTQTLAEGRELYHVDAEVLGELRPDLVLTQGLCDVCAVSVRAVKSSLSTCPTVLSLDAGSVEEVLSDIQRVAAAAGVSESGVEVTRELRVRLASVRRGTAGLPPRKVVCLEWLDPLYNAGHWVPEMVEIAGGVEMLSRKGAHSRRLEWNQVVEAAPNVLLLMPCGFGPHRSLEELRLLRRLPGWEDLPAVREGEVWAVDSNSYFSRPGPRLIDGVELTARILHPDRFGAPEPSAAMRATETTAGR